MRLVESQIGLVSQRLVCPICGNAVRPAPWHECLFYDDFAAKVAATLITHYRHEHTDYDQKVGRCRDYVKFKRDVNNKAMRHLIRTYRKLQPYGWKSVVYAFGRMADIDDKTYRSIIQN